MFSEIFLNPAMIAIGLSLFLAQIVKPFWAKIRRGKYDWTMLFSASGMPSSHSSMVSSVTLLIGLEQGFDSYLFAAIFAFALLVMYDAMGVRRAAGEQAEVLNHLLDQIGGETKNQFSLHHLRERLGHTPLQVFVGMILGVMVAILVYWIDVHIML